MKNLYYFLLEYFRNFENLEIIAKPSAALITLVIIILVAWLSHFIARRVIVTVITRLAHRTKFTWDDVLIRNRLFGGLAHFVPALIIYYTSDFSYPDIHQDLAELSPDQLEFLARDYYFSLAGFLLKIARVYLTLIVVFVANSLLNSSLEIYNTTAYAPQRPIKGYLQLMKILIFSLAVIMVIAVIVERDPTVLIAGLGAIAAVLILVFKDTILGFVASIQLSANNMVKIGDWIQMPGHNADGTVIDITLNTVKVQNWDKTIATIPTYALVSESFNNWKGMEEAGGRRIKRSVYIDMRSIRFCDAEMLNRLRKFELIKDYVVQKEAEIEEYNRTRKINQEDMVSGRRQTNVGIFRKYLEVYLRQHPGVHQELTFLVRHLQPTEKGLPVEIYVFTKDIAWARYEAIQADIFDHIFAVIPEFDLKVFQAPSGADVADAVSRFS